MYDDDYCEPREGGCDEPSPRGLLTEPPPREMPLERNSPTSPVTLTLPPGCRLFSPTHELEGGCEPFPRAEKEDELTDVNKGEKEVIAGSGKHSKWEGGGTSSLIDRLSHAIAR